MKKIILAFLYSSNLLSMLPIAKNIITAISKANFSTISSISIDVQKTKKLIFGERKTLFFTSKPFTPAEELFIAQKKGTCKKGGPCTCALLREIDPTSVRIKKQEFRQMYNAVCAAITFRKLQIVEAKNKKDIFDDVEYSQEHVNQAIDKLTALQNKVMLVMLCEFKKSVRYPKNFTVNKSTAVKKIVIEPINMQCYILPWITKCQEMVDKNNQKKFKLTFLGGSTLLLDYNSFYQFMRLKKEKETDI